MERERKRNSVWICWSVFILCEVFLSHLIKSWHIKREIVNIVYHTRMNVNGDFMYRNKHAGLHFKFMFSNIIIHRDLPHRISSEKENFLLLKCHYSNWLPANSRVSWLVHLAFVCLYILVYDDDVYKILWLLMWF